MQSIAKILTKKYNADSKTVEYIIENESGWNPHATGDMDIICSRTGEPVRARGIMQITECYYPEITDKQAYSPIFALDWSIQKIADTQTCISQWTTCRKYYAKI